MTALSLNLDAHSSQKTIQIPKNIPVGDNHPKILQIIQKHFNELANRKTEERYKYKGDEEDYLFPENDALPKYLRLFKKNFPRLSALDFVKEELFKHKKKYKFTILDIGAGSGKFIKKCKQVFKDRNVSFTGMSACDTRVGKDKKKLKFVFGDAHNLTKYFQPNSYDLIISANTFYHFSDCIRALMQAYRVLKPNGKMLIGHFALDGISLKTFEYSLKLAKCSYKIVYVDDFQGLSDSTHSSPQEDSKLGYLIIEKTKPELTLPLSYDDKDFIQTQSFFSQRPILKFIYKPNFSLIDRIKIIFYKVHEFIGSFI